MAFPTDILPVKVELLRLVGGSVETWTDISTYVNSPRSMIEIKRGVPNERGQADQTDVSLELNNIDGRFSWRNPNGAYFGQFGRNSQLRISIPGSTRMLSNYGYYSCPDSVGNSITGDIDVRYDADLTSWGAPSPAGAIYLFGKYTDDTNRSWYLNTTASGLVNFVWYTGAALKNARSTVPLPTPLTGRKAIRVTLDVDNGSAGWTATFYTSDTIGGTWTQLGAAVTGSGTTSIADTTAQVRIGDLKGTGYCQRQVYAAKALQGIGGTERVNPDFTAQSAGTANFNDAAGNTWSAAGDAFVSDRSFRASVEMPSWPADWDTTGTDVWIPMRAAGLLKRLSGSSATPLFSSMRRKVALLTQGFAPKAYWPCEDGESSTVLASGIAGGTPLTVQVGNPTFGSYSDFLCSDALPLVNSSRWEGAIGSYAGAGNITAHFLGYIPSATVADATPIFTLFTSGTAYRWDILYRTGNNIELRVYDAVGTSLLASGAVAVTGTTIDDTRNQYSLRLLISGSDVAYTLYVNSADNPSLNFTYAGTLAGKTTPRATGVRINRTSASLGATVIGHIYVTDYIDSFGSNPGELNAWSGELAGDRFWRLCTEEGVTPVLYGNGANTSAMGPQTRSTLISLLRECEDVDGGFIFEPRDTFGLAYTTLNAIESQLTVDLDLDYTAFHLSEVPRPTDDDLYLENDVTVSRPNGSSARQTLTTGNLSINQPPVGVGPYPKSYSINVNADSQLPDQAGWRLHLGTVDLSRCPTLGINLARSVFATNATLTAAARELDVGGRVRLQHPPSQLGVDALNLLAIGFTEQLAQYVWSILINTIPEDPYHVVVWDDAGSFYTSDGSTVNGAHTAVTTSLSVATASGPLWTHADGNFDLMLGSGERVTVTNVTGATSPQTFTVTRSVNGISKALSGGETVELFDVKYWGLT